jgi:hypothetical protein
LNPTRHVVELRQIKVLRYDPDAVAVADGLADGEIVVTAGVHTLYPGEVVRQLDNSAALGP